jgi:hypothetical protein
MITSGAPYAEWHKIAEDATAYGADVNWPSLESAWKAVSQGGDLTVRSEPALRDEISDAQHAGRQYTAKELRKYHDAGRLSFEDMLYFVSQTDTQATLVAQQSAAASSRRSADAAEQKNRDEQRKFDTTEYLTELRQSNPDMAYDTTGTTAKQIDLARDTFEVTYERLQRQGASSQEARKLAGRAANAQIKSASLKPTVAIETSTATESRGLDADLEQLEGTNFGTTNPKP